MGRLGNRSRFISVLASLALVAGLLMVSSGVAEATHLSGAGYTVTDSSEPGGPVFAWEDISATGTNISMGGDDQSTGALPIGFNFQFFGISYSEAFVSTNGLVTFGSGSSQYSNTAIPDPNPVNNMIAAFWDDQYPPCGGSSFYYETLGSAPNRRFVVMFNNMAHISNCAYRYSYEVKLLEGTNAIEVHYLDIDTGGPTDATLGIENSDGTLGVQYATGSPALSGTAVRYGDPQGTGSAPGGTTYHDLFVETVGQGVVTSEGYGINCGTDCSEKYAENTFVTLVATAAEGSTFSGWSGACTGAAPKCSVTMTGLKRVTANFVSAGPPDADDDGVADANDNCVNDANADQADKDNDGIGDACDPTDDSEVLVGSGPCEGAAVDSRTSLAGGGEMIVGTPGADALVGTGEGDVICGLGGADDLRGRGGDDRIAGGGGDDELRGGADNDTLRGNRGDDDLFGGSGERDDCRGGIGTNTKTGCELP